MLFSLPVILKFFFSFEKQIYCVITALIMQQQSPILWVKSEKLSMQIFNKSSNFNLFIIVQKNNLKIVYFSYLK